jgi:hypothetical protein
MINTSIHMGDNMVLTKQTVFMAPVATGWTGLGSMDPFPVPNYVSAQFEIFLHGLIDAGKTDGIQYSRTLGTLLRKWVDEESANAYLNYVRQHYFIDLGNPMEEGTFIVEDLSV